jgi:hypothetical protein
MDLEGLVLSTTPLAVAAARTPSDEVASERDGRNGGFGFGGAPYRMVKQASDWVDVLAEQGRFAPVRGRVSC